MVLKYYERSRDQPIASYQPQCIRSFVVRRSDAQFRPYCLAVEQKSAEPTRDTVVRQEPQVVLVELERQRKLFL